MMTAPRTRRDQSGMTLIEMLLSMAVAGIIAVPLFGLVFMTLNQREDATTRTKQAATFSLLNSYLVRDVANSDTAREGLSGAALATEAGATCAAGITDSQLVTWRQGTSGAKTTTAIYYADPLQPTNLRRRECVGGVVSSTISVATNIQTGSALATCDNRVGRNGDRCGVVKLKIAQRTGRAKNVTLSASRRTDKVPSVQACATVASDLPAGCLTSAVDKNLAAAATATFTLYAHAPDGTPSRDSAGGTDFQYRWEFGDGTAGVDVAGPNPNTAVGTDHSYAPGAYTARLIVTDRFDPKFSSVTTVSIRVNRAPLITDGCVSVVQLLGSPGDPGCQPSRTARSVNDTFRFSVTATDDTPGLRYLWSLTENGVDLSNGTGTSTYDYTFPSIGPGYQYFYVRAIDVDGVYSTTWRYTVFINSDPVINACVQLDQSKPENADGPCTSHTVATAANPLKIAGENLPPAYTFRFHVAPGDTGVDADLLSPLVGYYPAAQKPSYTAKWTFGTVGVTATTTQSVTCTADPCPTSAIDKRFTTQMSTTGVHWAKVQVTDHMGRTSAEQTIYVKVMAPPQIANPCVALPSNTANCRDLIPTPNKATGLYFQVEGSDPFDGGPSPALTYKWYTNAALTTLVGTTSVPNFTYAGFDPNYNYMYAVVVDADLLVSPSVRINAYVNATPDANPCIRTVPTGPGGAESGSCSPAVSQSAPGVIGSSTSSYTFKFHAKSTDDNLDTDNQSCARTNACAGQPQWWTDRTAPPWNIPSLAYDVKWTFSDGTTQSIACTTPTCAATAIEKTFTKSASGSQQFWGDVEITDKFGETSGKKRVYAYINSAPTADFSWKKTPDVGYAKLLLKRNLGLTTNLSTSYLSTSTDPDVAAAGDVLTYKWEKATGVDPNALTWSVLNTSDPTQLIPDVKSGTFWVRLTVTDKYLLSSTLTKRIIQDDDADGYSPNSQDLTDTTAQKWTGTASQQANYILGDDCNDYVTVAGQAYNGVDVFPGNTDAMDSPGSTKAGLDSNCDGFDGDVSKQIFVVKESVGRLATTYDTAVGKIKVNSSNSENPSSAACGYVTGTVPNLEVTPCINYSVAKQKMNATRNVIVLGAGGGIGGRDAQDSIAIDNVAHGVEVYGGFGSNNFQRGANVSINDPIAGPTDTTTVITSDYSGDVLGERALLVRSMGLSKPVVVQDVTLRSKTPTDLVSNTGRRWGQSSYGAVIVDSGLNQAVKLINMKVITGNGAPGEGPNDTRLAAGDRYTKNGSQGTLPTPIAGTPGGASGSGQAGTCNATSRGAGGTGGFVNPSGGNRRGGDGGGGGLMDTNCSPPSYNSTAGQNGFDGAQAVPGQYGTHGDGAARSYGGFICNITGWLCPDSNRGPTGFPGLDGKPGANNNSAAAAAVDFGLLSSAPGFQGVWQPDTISTTDPTPRYGGSGGAGGEGGGGGGGGGSGGADAGTPDQYGAGGGGGGEGGYGALNGGLGGGPGGASIGVYVTSSNPLFQNVTITMGTGGRGGDGGAGADGGNGAAGGAGGNNPASLTGKGGTGGKGGKGGASGGGAGGNGGPSIGLLYPVGLNVTTAPTCSGGAGGPGGTGGQAGTSGTFAASGNTGKTQCVKGL